MKKEQRINGLCKALEALAERELESEIRDGYVEGLDLCRDCLNYVLAAIGPVARETRQNLQSGRSHKAALCAFQLGQLTSKVTELGLTQDLLKAGALSKTVFSREKKLRDRRLAGSAVGAAARRIPRQVETLLAHEINEFLVLRRDLSIRRAAEIIHDRMAVRLIGDSPLVPSVRTIERRIALTKKTRQPYALAQRVNGRVPAVQGANCDEQKTTPIRTHFQATRRSA